MVADRPVADAPSDCLGFGAYADALAELIDNEETQTPLSLGISAPWGAGKTSLAQMVEQRLLTDPPREGRSPHITCWFDAWAHDDAAHLGSALAADVANTLDPFRGWRRFVEPLPSRMLTAQQRVRRRGLLTLLGVLTLVAAVVAAVALGRSDWLPGSVTEWASVSKGGTVGVGLAALLWGVFVAGTKVLPAASSLASFVLDPGSEATRGSMAAVRQQMGRLVSQATAGGQSLRRRAGRRRVVIFVDDLERCRPPRAVEVCEVARKLLDHPGVVIVFVGDLSVIAAAARLRYQESDGASTDGAAHGMPPNHGWQFLQKMIQVRFDLPPSPSRRLQDMVTAQALHGDGSDGATPAWDAASADGPAPARRERRRPRFRAWRGLVRWLACSATGHLAPTGAAVAATAAVTVAWQSPLTGLATGLLTGLVVALAEGAVVRARRGSPARRRSQLEHHIERLRVEPDYPDTASLSEQVVATSPVAVPDRRLVTLLVRRRIIDDSVLRSDVETELLAYLPPLPRSAKQTVNHLRLVLAVATDRGLLGGTPPLTPAHLAKWVVLAERWPALARALNRDPWAMQRLEEPHIQQELTPLLEDISPATEVSQDLIDFLRTGSQLGPVMERLVYLRPTEDEASTGCEDTHTSPPPDDGPDLAALSAAAASARGTGDASWSMEPRTPAWALAQCR